MKNEEDLSYQQLITELEGKINALHKSDLDMESSLKLYEEAMEIYVKCSNKLQEAEKQILKIKEEADGKLTEVPFTIEGE